MSFHTQIDYHTYTEIMDELLNPISDENLEPDLVVRLYQSKLVYLENLRAKCFMEINRGAPSPFSTSDYKLILEALGRTKTCLQSAMVRAISYNLSKRKAV